MSGNATGFAERLQHWRYEQRQVLDGTPEDDPFAQVRQTGDEREFSW
jgi:hypothetical protein